MIVEIADSPGNDHLVASIEGTDLWRSAQEKANGLLVELRDEMTPTQTWHPELEVWEDSGGNELHIWKAAGLVCELTLRVDLRGEFLPTLGKVSRIASGFGVGFVSESSTVILATEAELVAAALASRAGRFVRDPQLYLRRTELGGFEDA